MHIQRIFSVIMISIFFLNYAQVTDSQYNDYPLADEDELEDEGDEYDDIRNRPRADEFSDYKDNPYPGQHDNYGRNFPKYPDEDMWPPYDGNPYPFPRVDPQSFIPPPYLPSRNGYRYPPEYRPPADFASLRPIQPNRSGKKPYKPRVAFTPLYPLQPTRSGQREYRPHAPMNHIPPTRSVQKGLAQNSPRATFSPLNHMQPSKTERPESKVVRLCKTNNAQSIDSHSDSNARRTQPNLSDKPNQDRPRQTSSSLYSVPDSYFYDRPSAKPITIGRDEYVDCRLLPSARTDGVSRVTYPITDYVLTGDGKLDAGEKVFNPYAYQPPSSKIISNSNVYSSIPSSYLQEKLYSSTTSLSFLKKEYELRKSSTILSIPTKSVPKTMHEYILKSVSTSVSPSPKSATSKSYYVSPIYSKATSESYYISPSSTRTALRTYYVTPASIRTSPKGYYLHNSYGRTTPKSYISSIRTKPTPKIFYVPSSSTRSKTITYSVSPSSMRTTPKTYYVSTIYRKTTPKSYYVSPSSTRTTSGSHYVSPSSTRTSKSYYVPSIYTKTIPKSYYVSPIPTKTTPKSYYASPSSTRTTHRTYYVTPTSIRTTPKGYYPRPTTKSYVSPTRTKASPKNYYVPSSSTRRNVISYFVSPSSIRTTPKSYYASTSYTKTIPKSYYVSPSLLGTTSKSYYLPPNYTKTTPKSYYITPIPTKATSKSYYVPSSSTRTIHKSNFVSHSSKINPSKINYDSTSYTRAIPNSYHVSQSFTKSKSRIYYASPSYTRTTPKSNVFSTIPTKSTPNSYYITSSSTRITNTNNYVSPSSTRKTRKSYNDFPITRSTTRTNYYVSNSSERITPKSYYVSPISTKETLKMYYASSKSTRTTTKSNYVSISSKTPKSYYMSILPTRTTPKNDYASPISTRIIRKSYYVSSPFYYSRSMTPGDNYLAQSRTKTTPKSYYVYPVSTSATTKSSMYRNPCTKESVHKLGVSQSQETYKISSRFPYVATEYPLIYDTERAQNQPMICIHYADNFTHNFDPTESSSVQQDINKIATFNPKVYSSSSETKNNYKQLYSLSTSPLSTLYPQFHGRKPYGSSSSPSLLPPEYQHKTATQHMASSTTDYTHYPVYYQPNTLNLASANGLRQSATSSYTHSSDSYLPDENKNSQDDHGLQLDRNYRGPIFSTRFPSDRYSKEDDEKVLVPSDVPSSNLGHETKRLTPVRDIVIPVILNLPPDKIPIKGYSSLGSPRTFEVQPIRLNENLDPPKISDNPYLSKENIPIETFTVQPKLYSPTHAFPEMETKSGSHQIFRLNYTKHHLSSMSPKYPNLPQTRSPQHPLSNFNYQLSKFLNDPPIQNKTYSSSTGAQPEIENQNQSKLLYDTDHDAKNLQLKTFSMSLSSKTTSPMSPRKILSGGTFDLRNYVTESRQTGLHTISPRPHINVYNTTPHLHKHTSIPIDGQSGKEIRNDSSIQSRSMYNLYYGNNNSPSNNFSRPLSFTTASSMPLRTKFGGTDPPSRNYFAEFYQRFSADNVAPHLQKSTSEPASFQSKIPNLNEHLASPRPIFHLYYDNDKRRPLTYSRLISSTTTPPMSSKINYNIRNPYGKSYVTKYHQLDVQTPTNYLSTPRPSFNRYNGPVKILTIPTLSSSTTSLPSRSRYNRRFRPPSNNPTSYGHPGRGGNTRYSPMSGGNQHSNLTIQPRTKVLNPGLQRRLGHSLQNNSHERNRPSHAVPSNNRTSYGHPGRGGNTRYSPISGASQHSYLTIQPRTKVLNPSLQRRLGHSFQNNSHERDRPSHAVPSNNRTSYGHPGRGGNTKYSPISGGKQHSNLTIQPRTKVLNPGLQRRFDHPVRNNSHERNRPSHAILSRTNSNKGSLSRNSGLRGQSSTSKPHFTFGRTQYRFSGQHRTPKAIPYITTPLSYHKSIKT